MSELKERSNHLEFYQQHQIAPVLYNTSNMDHHLERRYFLYSRLGLPPVAFRNARVLEVAAGTGQNSLYIASLMPSELVLLEPNPTAIKHIHETYAQFGRPHCFPQVIMSKLEDFSTKNQFDIVLCENWLGTSSHELNLLQKLGGLVAPNGMLVITNVLPIGILPNILRRFLSAYIAPISLSFEHRTELLVQAFASHLQTIKGMTRNVVDWVQDNMINPAYFDLCLTPMKTLEVLNDGFEIIGSSPAISEDWRWFKEMTRKSRNLNDHFFEQYWKKAHNFLDYRSEITLSDSMINRQLEEKAMALLQAVKHHEDAHIHNQDISKNALYVSRCFSDLMNILPEHHLAQDSLKEIRSFIDAPEMIAAEAIADMQSFSALFGRETSYLSLAKGLVG